MNDEIRLDILEDETLREVAKLKYVYGLTISQIAEKIGYSERQVNRFIKKIKQISEVADIER